MADIEKVTDDRTLFQKLWGVKDEGRKYKTPQIHVDQTDEFKYQKQPWPALCDKFLESKTLQDAYEEVKHLEKLNLQKQKPPDSVVAYNKAALLYNEFQEKHKAIVLEARKYIEEKQAQIKALEGKPIGLADRESVLQKFNSELNTLKSNLVSLKASNYNIDLSGKAGTD